MDSKKGKKKTPEQRYAEFLQWKQSEEFKILQEIKEMKDSLPLILEITEDFLGKWQQFLDLFLNVGKVYKIKKINLKSIQQNQIRTAFFGGVNKRDEPFVIDFKELDFENKENQKVCRHVKITFVDFIKQTDNLDILDENRYIDFKKNKIIYKFKEFINFFKEHIKKGRGHEESEKLLKLALQPFRELLESNFKLSLFESKNFDETNLYNNYFQYKALIEDFSSKYQPCQNILFRTSDEITSDPDIYTILKLINYENWQQNVIEHYFIFPLLQAYNKMRANLIKTYSLGMGFWKQPLKENDVFLDNVKEMIQKQQKAEFLFGNCLRRYQSNFFYNVIKEIMSQELRQGLQNKDERLTHHVLPAVIILESMIHLQKIYIKKQSDIDDDFFDFKISKQRINFELKKHNQEDKRIEQVIPEGYQKIFYVKQILGPRKPININDNDVEELEKIGRFFILYDYIPKENHDEFVERSLDLKNLNPLIIKDIRDFFIMKGLVPNGQSYIQNRQNAIEQMNLIKHKIENENKENIGDKKPPNLWNNPLISQDKKNYFYSVDLFNDHKDSYVLSLYNYIEQMVFRLTEYQKENWENHLNLILEAFNQLSYVKFVLQYQFQKDRYSLINLTKTKIISKDKCTRELRIKMRDLKQ